VSGVVLVLVLLGTGLGAPAARADGDPASDVLVSENLYLPADAGVSVKQQAQLNADLGACEHVDRGARGGLNTGPATPAPDRQ
jgi:hypothetical protein